MSDASWLRWRILLTTAFALGIAFLTYYVEASIAMANSSFSSEQLMTRYRIRHVVGSVRAYQTENKTLPPDLKTLSPEQWSQSLLSDGWNRPLLYSVQNKQALIESLGRDGVRGGIGLDADLSNLSPHPARAALPLTQQLSQPLGRIFLFAALICGVLAASLVFPQFGDPPVSADSWFWLTLQLGLSFLMAAVMAGVGALFIAIAHIPSGH